jgi:hypothetical protein
MTAGVPYVNISYILLSDPLLTVRWNYEKSEFDEVDNSQVLLVVE